MTDPVERRLARLRFDLHDGPQQDVHLLGQDLRLFREQLGRVLAPGPDAERLIGRLDDLEAQLSALDEDLRRLSSKLESPFRAAGPLPEGLAQLTEAFARRTGIEPELRLEGDLADLSDSQQITLLALVREALSNVRKHSGAKAVKIDVAASGGAVEVRITDDGQGFDPEGAISAGVGAGHLGLVGMHERVRMLGGRTRITSRPGGPTEVAAYLPNWDA